MFSGQKVWAMSDADFRISVGDFLAFMAGSFEEKPTYEEFRQAIESEIEAWFEDLEQQEVYGVIYYPPYGEGEPLYIRTAKNFMWLIDERYDLKSVYEEFFGQESSPRMKR